MSSNQDLLVHPKYRPDIDGIRAIAILSVIAFHAFPEWFPGGFIGVDIFFVISGFLISTIIIGSLNSESFSFTNFYVRRIRRIFPALLIVLIAAMVLGWFYLLADEYAHLGKHTASAAGFVVNFALWGESGYFDTASETKPLLHLWSLGIEEQFYIIFPLILWAAYRVRINLLLVTAVLTLVSFGLNIAETNPVADFYSPLTRFWELMVGAMLAAFSSGRIKHYQHLSAAGVVLIAAALVLLSKQNTFPGWWALLPVLGAAFLIAAGPKSAINLVVLSNPTLVWIGLISYPLYLWHWVLLSFARIVEVATPALEIRAMIVMVSFLLAWLTWRFIEQPLRVGVSRIKTISLVIAMVIVGSSGYLAYWSDGYPWRSNQVEYQTFEPQFAHWDYKKNETCTKDYTKDQLSFLIFCVANSDSPELILFGDSHANHLYPGLLHAYGDGTGVLSVGNGTPLDGVHVRFDKPTDHPWINGDKSYDLVLHRILTSKTIKTVIYAAHWEGPIHGRFVLEEHRLRVGDVHLSRNGMAEDNKAIFKLGFEKTLETLLDSGKNVVVVIDTPEVMVNPRKCLRDLKSETLCSFSKKSVMDRQEYSRAFIAEMKAKYPQIKVFDPVPIVCPTDDVA